MSNKINHSMSLAKPDALDITTKQKIALATGIVGLFIFVLALLNTNFPNKGIFLTSALLLIAGGIIVYSREAYLTKLEGIKNDGQWFKSISSRGVWGWVLGLVLTGFYIVLYFYPKYLGLDQGVDGGNTGLISLFDPLSQLLSGRDASQWFVYGTLYTLAILAFGYKFILKYRHNKYQQLRTFSVMFFQLGFAFLIPEFMYVMNNDLPYYDLKSVWPLNYYIFDEWSVNGFLSNGNIGLALILFGIISIFIITPILTYKFGKRWYCSWVCGCGGLAETAGDSFRHLSSKKMSAWKIERWLIHLVLVFSVVMTTAMIYTYLGYDKNDFWLTRGVFISLVIGFLTLIFAGVMYFKRQELGKDAKFGAIGFFSVIALLLIMHFTGTTDHVFYIKGGALRSAYGIYIGSIFSGVIGTGFYPILGSRSWCRFGCPMAAILGFQQRLFSKFRITTNGGQCISCGNCSNSCEMGIDVRHYAQKGENIVRSSCVGCGICSAVCPRGVLKLENDSMKGRINPTEVLLGNDVDLMELVNQK
ncbi:FeS-binding protein [Winogradskyella sp. PC-19]|uniref:4Fe-4S binding protein n=1 Tax=unclassified Winogradskyella TaxID=2615021 RepID=UPI000B3BED45|nr:MULTISPECIES: 4Fe-4S dicluster domain-containing protein [unclassified Winogradskyella]ARV10105.1 FeS-binding protein [Winogradskyella sp. PC-19]RZN83552.1 MAG: 4Fe-4S binding protein [Winogradskyella sp.]